ncbi:4-(cytidine 5'-diphospho)-2-C-methyl-D-erythritol kinase [Bifidobacterium choloepi]|uniref:4-diphosphocytidyl-2-C-methyl-D-erythritol kinase n=1 Tax=Bifidobacterium choloepi TaxID=2614131 RepID=A0A6I5MZ93_9BIFI|nr:4-(cytidine 5'-diphospho)-2-C-methyl-D-erythritol kinase [Bifidobacterium choloepi]NEG69968.1 4-(cytidine 5'-diphospho)-2-C-methyl-D-erythritol kinase [Bifidobacterium choloepi]
MTDDNTPGTLGAVSVDCPAKTNLTLHVGERHDEWGGRHALDTVYCGLGIYDTVTVEQKRPSTGFSLDISGRFLGDLASSSTDLRRNHAVRALFTMAHAAGREADISISIEKEIPVGAGLGGGSADAAAVILGLNALWELDWPLEKLQAIAAGLGADMPFCLSGGYARGTGFGERIELLDATSPTVAALRADGFDGDVIVGAYRAELGTPEVYGLFDELGDGDGDLNSLQKAAIELHPRSGRAIELALEAGATQAFVSGSGPSVVAFVPDGAAMEAVDRSWREWNAVDRLITATAPAVPIVRHLDSPEGDR